MRIGLVERLHDLIPASVMINTRLVHLFDQYVPQVRLCND